MNAQSSLPRFFIAFLAALLPIQAFSQTSLPFSLGKDYLRSEITAVIGAPERFGYGLSGDDDLFIQTYGKGIILNQHFKDLDLKWVSEEERIRPIVDFKSSQFTGRRAPIIGIALTDPTYRILEDKIPGGLYVGMPRTALKSIEGAHTDGWPAMMKNNYRITFDDDTMVLMYYNAWDRVTFIEYINHDSGIFFWPKEDPYTPVDEKDRLVTSFHGPDDLRDVLVPSDPADAFSNYSANDFQDNPAVRSESKKVSLPTLLDFDRQRRNTGKDDITLVETPFRQNGWQGLKAVLHNGKDDINWDIATAIHWYYLQESNRAILKDRIVTQFARKGFESNQANYSGFSGTKPTNILVYTDLQGEVNEIRIYYGGKILFGRLLKRGEKLQPGEKARYVTVFKDVPQPKFLGIFKRKDRREIIGTYCVAEHPVSFNRR